MTILPHITKGDVKMNKKNKEQQECVLTMLQINCNLLMTRVLTAITLFIIKSFSTTVAYVDIIFSSSTNGHQLKYQSFFTCCNIPHYQHLSEVLKTVSYIILLFFHRSNVTGLTEAIPLYAESASQYCRAGY